MMDRLASRDWHFQGVVVRTFIGNDGEPRFVGNDVCGVLKHSNPRVMLSRLDADMKELLVLPTPGGPQEMVVISESGVYELAFTSRRPEAKQFRKWVTTEVLPAIRKTGRYSIAPEGHDPIRAGIRAMDDLRVAQLACEQLSSALSEAVARRENAMLTFASLAGGSSLDAMLGWCREQACDPPAKVKQAPVRPDDDDDDGGDDEPEIDPKILAAARRKAARALEQKSPPAYRGY